MRIALVSLDQAWEDKGLNFQACRVFVRKASEQAAEVVVFPEMTLTSFSMNTAVTAEDRQTSETVGLFRELAREFQIAILFGVVFLDGDKATNNALLVDDAGDVKGNYGKIHPFSFAGEDRFFRGGDAVCAVKLGSVTVGLTICYDLRFPELYSVLGNRSQLIVNIANWPVKRIDHWNALLKARAIENQVFIVGVNRTGRDGNGLDYVKSSQVVDPNGELLHPVMSEGEIDVFDIDLEFVGKFKQIFSTTQDRRPELYKSLL